MKTLTATTIIETVSIAAHRHVKNSKTRVTTMPVMWTEMTLTLTTATTRVAGASGARAIIEPGRCGSIVTIEATSIWKK
jgi:hypothetical protein